MCIAREQFLLPTFGTAASFTPPSLLCEVSSVVNQSQALLKTFSLKSPDSVGSIGRRM